MIRYVIATVLLATPALAAPAPRQPTPTTVQEPSPNSAGSVGVDAKDPGGQREQARINERSVFMKRQEASEAKFKKTLGGICSGC